jgi:hypothetical protein
LRLIGLALSGLPSGCAPCDGAAENALQLYDKVGAAERSAGLLGRSEGRKSSVGSIGDQ